MPIKGLTDRMTERDVIQGKSVRLGFIGKGRREGFGRKIKLTDEDYFVFRPNNDDDRLAALFKEAYGDKPMVIPDVRIPVDIAGNFDIGQCAWMTASKHSEKGSTFLARSDGVNVKQMRMAATGRVKFFDDGEMLHADVSAEEREKDCFVYDGRKYPWQRSFAIDLLLPEFNRLVFKYDVAGYGVVTMTTHSINDIANLIQEYYAIVNELASLFLNPSEQDQARRWLPLRNFPIRLYRSIDKVGTPNYHKDAKASERLTSTRSLIHWQLTPEVSASIQSAIDQRTARLIEDIAKAPMLTAPDPVDRANADLFGDPQPAAPAALPEKTGYQPTDWDAIFESGEPVTVEDDEETVEAIFEKVTPAPKKKEPESDPKELDSSVEDIWAWMKDKYHDGYITQVALAESVIMLKAGMIDRKEVANWLNGGENKDLRDKGLVVDYRKKITTGGAETILKRAIDLKHKDGE